MLFNLLIANMEGEMEKVRWGGIEFGGRKEYSYADDVMLLAEEEDEMKSIIKRLEGYLEKKRFKLNLKKTKVMRKGKEGIEVEGKSNRRGDRTSISGIHAAEERWGHILGRGVRRTAAIMRMWGIGKRRYRKDWRKRVDKVIRQVGVDSCGLWDGDMG